MEKEILQYGGTVGALILIILLLVKEVIAGRRQSPNGFMIKEVCDERHKGLNDSIRKIESSINVLADKIDELPLRLNGGAKE